MNRMTHIALIALALSASQLISQPAIAQTIMTWDRAPLEIDTLVGKERRITFPGNVRIAMPEGLENRLTVQIVDRTVYLKALKPFARTRLIVEHTDSGKIVLLDVRAPKKSSSAGNTQEAIEIDTQETPAKSAEKPKKTDDESIDYVGLTQFAAKQLYAPKRLAQEEEGIQRVAVSTKPLLGLYRLAPLEARVAGAWRSDDLFITAVRLVNKGQDAIEFDPRLIRGQWLAITFQHGRVLAAGSESDTSVVYLISAQPFADAFK